MVFFAATATTIVMSLQTPAIPAGVKDWLDTWLWRNFVVSFFALFWGAIDFSRHKAPPPPSRGP